jgi:hypothetical protein
MVKKGKPAKAVPISSRVGEVITRHVRIKAKTEARIRTPLPGPVALVRQTLSILKMSAKPLGGILLVYLVLNFIFSGGLGEGSVAEELKGYIKDSPGHFSALGSALVSMGLLVGGSDGSTSASSGFSSLLLVVVSLAIIWALRRILAGQVVSVKESFYQGMKPLVPFLLVILVIVLQLLPMSIGAALLNLATTGALADSQAVAVFFTLLFLVLSAWSVYMLCSSIFALYIVTLPDRHPRAALRSAKKIVHHRRWPVLFRLLALPLLIFIAMAVIIVPLILFATDLVLPAFFLLSGLALLFTHTYLYNFYRNLIE